MKKVVELFCFVSFCSWRPYLSLSTRDVWREYSPSNGRKSVRGMGGRGGRWSAIVRTDSIFLSLGFQPLVFHSVARPCALYEHRFPRNTVFR